MEETSEKNSYGGKTLKRKAHRREDTLIQKYIKIKNASRIKTKPKYIIIKYWSLGFFNLFVTDFFFR